MIAPVWAIVLFLAQGRSVFSSDDPRLCAYALRPRNDDPLPQNASSDTASDFLAS
eukprot:CAMPEP_0196666704 /NCGR_PEP_ID=MMETSP1086-20130531/64668_1 /TAXON_ID=77921 /ORGANISM="Cyanoptyche  gloeocystis , Strain SAG4.97" /LENGTH=54 /DNA_ID=CAMNT_0042003937 /DNA_START=123 /DNA_END=287 /DNA_ORIENTATION=-